MASLPSGPGVVHVGMDTSVREIVCGVLRPGMEVPAVDRVPEPRGVGPAADRAAGRPAAAGGLLRGRAVGLRAAPAHHLDGGGVRGDRAVAGPEGRVGPGQDRPPRRGPADAGAAGRDADAVRVPSPPEEAVRDLVRARGDLLDDRRRAQQRLSAFLLRHGRVWGGLEVDLRAPGVGRPAGVRRAGDAGDGGRLPRRPGGPGGRAARGRGPAGRLGRREPLAPAVARLGAYRGIAELTALTLAAEVVDWRRFATARAFMGFTGLVPAEYSSGARTRRGSITKAWKGSGPRWWSPRGPTGTGPRSARCCAAARPGRTRRPWPAPGRRSSGCTPPGRRWPPAKPSGVTATAVARELAGFVWAEMTS